MATNESMVKLLKDLGKKLDELEELVDEINAMKMHLKRHTGQQSRQKRKWSGDKGYIEKKRVLKKSRKIKREWEDE